MHGRWSSYVAVGDSFTEGMDDPYGDGTYRGWADLVAERLAADTPGFRYANLAVRGRLLRPVIDAQLPLALAMRPELVSFVAGGNDVLRRRFDRAAVAQEYERAVAKLVATGATVLVFTPADITVNLPLRGMMRARVDFLLALVHRVVETHGPLLVDLWADDGFRDRRMWSIDRLHLNETGHRRVAAHVLDVLGVPSDPEWRGALPVGAPSRWMSARQADLRWARVHLAPWIGRRLAGRSSGDTITAKRPDLLEL